MLDAEPPVRIREMDHAIGRLDDARVRKLAPILFDNFLLPPRLAVIRRLNNRQRGAVPLGRVVIRKQHPPAGKFRRGNSRIRTIQIRILRRRPRGAAVFGNALLHARVSAHQTEQLAVVPLDDRRPFTGIRPSYYTSAAR